MPKIRIAPGAEVPQVLETARSVAEERGYLWEPDGTAGATASEGGKAIKHRTNAMRLRVRLSVDGDVLRLKQETHGAALAGASPFFLIRLSTEMRKVHKDITRALSDAGLT